MIEPVENLLRVPWMVVDDTGTLLVSAPDGVVLDFKVSKKQAEALPDALANNALWVAFFHALIGSLPVE